jgi:hypothetical protein
MSERALQEALPLELRPAAGYLVAAAQLVPGVKVLCYSAFIRTV